MLPMHPHPAMSQALISEFNGERTRVVRRPSPRHSSRLRAARSRRAARVAAATGGCA